MLNIYQTNGRTYRPFTTDQIFRKDLIGGKRLADTVTELTGDKKEVFLDFAMCMLEWLPEKRWTAKQLLEHPFFNSIWEDRERYFKGQPMLNE